MHKFQRKNIKHKKIAESWIDELFQAAKAIFKYNPSYSDRYVEQAKRISLKYKVKLPKKSRPNYCKHCLKYLKPGVNSRVRINNGKLVYYCKSCKRYTRVRIR